MSIRRSKPASVRVTTALRTHLRSNVVGYVALFFAMSLGTAWALGTNSVRSKHIVNGQVKASDVANGAIGSAKVSDNSLTGADVNSLTGTDVTDNSLTGADVNALSGTDVTDNSLTGDDISESALGPVPSAVLGGRGRTGAGGACDPESTTFITCASVSLSLPASTRVLVMAHSRAVGELGERPVGACRLGTSVGDVLPTSKTTIHSADLNDSDNLTLMGVTAPIGPGEISFGIDCNQDPNLGAVRYDDTLVSAVALGPG